ncbi:ABC transporter permease [Intrasporangium sp.]|uniref:ABC transporter permease n=1 Tax=Intrasporangium sp. TaxID=1925024 RepID=UPI003365552D
MSTTQIDRQPATAETGSPTTTPAPDVGAGAPWTIVASREIIVRLRDRTFIISTIITVVLIAALFGLQAYLGNRESEHPVAVTGTTATDLVEAAHQTARASSDTLSITAVPVPDAEAAEAALRDGTAESWLHERNGSWVLTSAGETDLAVTTAVQDAVRSAVLDARAAQAGTTVEQLTAGSEVTVDRLDGKPDNTGAIQGATFAFALLFYLAAMVFGLQIAGSVVEEKQSRLVEIIATAIPLRHLLAGKVIGNSVLAFGQVALYSAVGLVAVSFTDISTLLPGLTSAVIWFVAFFVVGFIALACLYAVAGALASRNEDLQSTTAPMTMVLMAIYFASFGLSGTAATVASYVPIASVISMPARILAGEAAWWEPVLALAIMAAFAYGVMLVGARIYRRSLMQTRGKLSWREGLRAGE